MEPHGGMALMGMDRVADELATACLGQGRQSRSQCWIHAPILSSHQLRMSMWNLLIPS